MSLTAIDLKDNLFALWLAAAAEKTPEQAFEYLVGVQAIKQEEKYCTGCGVIRPHKDFYKRSYGDKTRYVQPCKQCHKDSYKAKLNPPE